MRTRASCIQSVPSTDRYEGDKKGAKDQTKFVSKVL